MMKKHLFLILAMLAIAFGAAQAQNQDCNTDNKTCGHCGHHQSTILKGDAALDWAKVHAGELIANYLSAAGNKLDPDELRKQLAPIGYDGSDVPSYRKAEKYLVDTVYTIMLADAMRQGKTSIVLLTGPGGAGKSTSTKAMDFTPYGMIYDSAFNSYPSLKKAVDKAIKAGMKDVRVIAIYNDLLTCFKNSVKRGKVTKRFLGLGYLTNAFRSNAGKIAMLQKEYPQVVIDPVDNSHNCGGRRVDVDEALAWDFIVSPQLLNHMLTYTLYEIYEGELTGQQIVSVASDAQALEGLDETGKALVAELLRQVQAAR